jgi:hypothetical protein
MTGSKKAKAAVHEHQRLSDANATNNCGVSMPNQIMFYQCAGKRLDESALNRSSGGHNGRGLDKNANVVGHQPEGERHREDTRAICGGGKNVNE